MANLLELAREFPAVSITVNAADLLALGSAIVADTMAQYRAEIEAEKRETLLTATEAGQLLGVCEKTLARMRKRNAIEGVRVGGQIKYRRSDCLAIINERRA